MKQIRDLETAERAKGDNVTRVRPSPVPEPEPQKAAEIIAGHIRRDIATGKLKAGDALSSEGELATHFGVSRPTLRAAYRILESESLLTISRGAQGGPRVCHPGTEVVARNVGMLLQLRGTRVTDFSYARLVIEPPAAGLVAANQPPACVQLLTDLLAEEEAAVDDPPRFAQAAAKFYRAITDHCGNEILTVFGAVLQVLMEKELGFIFKEGAGRNDDRMEETLRRDLADHRKLLRLIQRGESAQAQRFWLRHLEWVGEGTSRVLPTVEKMPFTAFD